MLESLAAFVVVSAVVICTPGQDTALTIRNTLAGGRRSGIATGVGVSIGQAIWTLAASAGVVALLSASEPAFRALKLAGAVYLVYLGAQSIYAAFAHRGHDIDPKQQSVAKSKVVPTASRALRQGAISNLGNPKMAVFFASLLPQFAPGGSTSFIPLLALGLLFCSMTLGWLTLYAIAVARVRGILAGPVRHALDALTGIVLVLFGTASQRKVARQYLAQDRNALQCTRAESAIADSARANIPEGARYAGAGAPLTERVTWLARRS